MNIVYKARVALVRIGKVLPFIVCVFVLLSYVETLYALQAGNYVMYEDYVMLNKPLSFSIGEIMEYNTSMLLVCIVISISVETCLWNKIACAYLTLNLIEKAYFPTIEVSQTLIYFICIANIVVCSFITYKGLKILLFN